MIRQSVRAGTFAALATLAVLSSSGSAGAAPITPAVPASPGHGSGRICDATTCIYAYVDGRAQDGSIRASATVEPDPNGTKVVRLQLDRMYIVAGPGQLAARGPISRGTAAPVRGDLTFATADTCSTDYRVITDVSGRGADGSLVRGRIVGAPFYNSSAAACPGPHLSGRGTVHHFAPDAGFPQKVYIGQSVDGRAPYAWGEIDGHYQSAVARILIDRVILTVDGRLLSASSPPQQAEVVARFGSTVAVNLAAGHQWVPGCHYYVASMRYSVRYSDGHLYSNTWTSNAKAFQHCA